MVDLTVSREKERTFIFRPQSFPQIIHCIPIVSFIQNCGQVNFSVDE